MHNLTMPGVAGLDGSRTYTARGGHRRRSRPGHPPEAHRPGRRASPFDRAHGAAPAGLGVTRPPGLRHTRCTPSRHGTERGGPDLARGATVRPPPRTTPGRGAALAVDGDATTRWAVSAADRHAPTAGWPWTSASRAPCDRVTLRWETAAGRATWYRARPTARWTDLADCPPPALASTGGWLDVDGRAGLVVRGGPTRSRCTGTRSARRGTARARCWWRALPSVHRRAGGTRPPAYAHDRGRPGAGGGHGRAPQPVQPVGPAVRTPVSLVQESRHRRSTRASKW